MALWVWLAAPLIGLLLGLFGAGGGMLAVPLLIYGGGLPLKEAIALSVWIVALVSLVAATNQRVWRVLQWRLLIFFGVGGVIGGVLGALLGGWVPEWVQYLLFILLLFVVAGWMIKVKPSKVRQPAVPCNCPVTLLLGVVMGFATGLLGVGGGFLMVPALIALGISHLPTAVAHSLVLITFNAAAAGVTYLGVVPVPYPLLITVVLLAGAGSLLGGFLLKRLPVERLQSGFALLLALVGAGMLVDFLIH